MLEVIYAWAQQSDHRATVYEVILRADGELSWSCRGWIFQRKDQPRGCKHTKGLAMQAGVVLAAFRAGKPIPRFAAKPVQRTISRLTREEPAAPAARKIIKIGVTS